MTQSSDFLVAGGGIVGLALALEIRRKWPDASVTLLEKESSSVKHASGRNSGVLHAGFYYSPDSLKAKLTRDGNALLRQFCEEHNVPIRECGKVVVTSDEHQIGALEELFRRGAANGVELQMITPRELADLEPLARTVEKALWSPNTAVANPSSVTEMLAKVAQNEGVEVHYEAIVMRADGPRVSTSIGNFEVGHFINATGLYADRIAKPFGFSEDYVMLPFIGLYAYAPRLKGTLTRHVYPVPDPRNPFLGVHATVTVDGDFKIGPTAIPALSREAYRAFRDVKIGDLSELSRTFPKFLFSPHHNVLSLLRTEFPKYSRTWLVHEARKLVPSLRRRDFTIKGRPGIRAQLFDVTKKRLEMDFVVRGDEKSTHVLNAVSPAWTSSLSFAAHVTEDIARRVH